MEKQASTLELFFDLVFVFAITQVVGLVVHDLTLHGFAQGALLMALLWWGWTQYTWAANAIDLDPRSVRVSIVVAMGVAFVMAQAVPFAFEDGGMWVAGAYVALRAIGLWKYWTGVGDDPVRRALVRVFAINSSIGPVVVVVGGLVDDPLRSWLWLGACCLEVVAAFRSASGDDATSWGVEPGHFVERHGLIIIVALGETIVAVGLGLADKQPSLDTSVLLTVALGGSAVLWWSYFGWLQDRLEQVLVRAGGSGYLARDVFSFLHYPIILGVVFFAVAAEEAFSHADEALTTGGRVALGVAVALVIGGEVAALFRAERTVLIDRIAAIAVSVVVISAGAELRGVWLIGIVMVILAAALTLEHRAQRGRAVEGARGGAT